MCVAVAVAVVVVVVAVVAVVAVVVVAIVAIVAVVAVVVVCCSQHRNEKMSIRVFAMLLLLRHLQKKHSLNFLENLKSGCISRSFICLSGFSCYCIVVVVKLVFVRNVCVI